MWLQKDDRSLLAFHIDYNEYRLFKLQSITRRGYTYSREIFHDTIISGLAGFFGVQVQVNNTTFVTDGYRAKHTLDNGSVATVSTIVANIQNFQRCINRYIIYSPPQVKASKWDVLILDQASNQLPNDDIGDFLSEIETLLPDLKRNLGGIHEVHGLAGLANAIEMEQALAVSDASLGSRDRAAHGYVLESRCGR